MTKEKIILKDCSLCVFVRNNDGLYCSLKMKDENSFSEYAKTQSCECGYFKQKKSA